MLKKLRLVFSGLCSIATITAAIKGAIKGAPRAPRGPKPKP